MRRKTAAAGAADQGERLRAAIIRYLERNPEAADSGRGISEWWVPGSGEQPSAAQVRAVLDRLIADGILSRREMPDGTFVYSLPSTGGGTCRKN